MSSAEIKIPFGYKQVHGPSHKGDGIWNGRRFAKVKKCYPFAGDSGAVIIRKQDAVQTEIPATAAMDVTGVEVMDL